MHRCFIVVFFVFMVSVCGFLIVVVMYSLTSVSSLIRRTLTSDGQQFQQYHQNRQTATTQRKLLNTRQTMEFVDENPDTGLEQA